MRKGFTLIETLVALALLAILAPALLEAWIAGARIERSVSFAESVSLEIDRALVESICGEIAASGSEQYPFCCEISRASNGHERGSLPHWTLTSKERRSSRILLYSLSSAVPAE